MNQYRDPKAVILEWGTKIGAASLLAAVVIGFATKDSDKPTDRAVCEGTQAFEVQPGMGSSDLLAQIENGTANPTDATAKIRELNPGVDLDTLADGSYFVDNTLVRRPLTVSLPTGCFAEAANTTP